MFKVGDLVVQNGFMAGTNGITSALSTDKRMYRYGLGMNMEQWLKDQSVLRIVDVYSNERVRAKLLDGSMPDGCTSYDYHPSELRLVSVAECHGNYNRSNPYKAGESVVIMRPANGVHRFWVNSKMQEWIKQGTVVRVQRTDQNDCSISVGDADNMRWGGANDTFWVDPAEVRFATAAEIAAVARNLPPAPPAPAPQPVVIAHSFAGSELPVPTPELKKYDVIDLKDAVDDTEATITFYNDGRPMITIDEAGNSAQIVLSGASVLELLRVLEADRENAQVIVDAEAAPQFKRGDRVRHDSGVVGVVVSAGMPLACPDGSSTPRWNVLYQGKDSVEQSRGDRLTALPGHMEI